MNKKRRSLTLAALAVFGLIIFFHYCDPWFHQRQLSFGVGGAWHGGRYIAGSIEPLIADVRMPLFALAVVYAGLFFLFGGKDAEPVPRRPINWRAIILWTIAGFLITGGTYGIVRSNQYQQEHERQRNEFLRHQEERRKAIDKEIASNIEAEASKHRISTKEIDLINMQLGPVQHAVGVFHLTGRIRNHAPHWNTLWSIDLKITIREKGSADILGEATWPITITVPGNQTVEST
jgi:hypothetical protein